MQLWLSETVQKSVGDFVKWRSTDGDACCSSCQKKGKIMTRSVVKSCPKTLLVHLTRLSVTSNFLVRKDNSHISINDIIEVEKTKYSLAGMIMHHGPSEGNGHYTNKIKVDKEGSGAIWYTFDDDRVIASPFMSASKSTVQNCYAI
jgi:ubiquitin C-terminal hydrolase